MSASYNIRPSRIEIIYIEDNPGDQQLLKEQLSLAEGYLFQIRLADNFKIARQQYQAYAPDLLLLDLNLEDTKDCDTIDVAIRTFPGVPILVLSQSHNLDISFYASSRGIVDFLVKDGILNTEKLVRAILMAKLRWEVEQEKLSLIQNNLRASLTLLDKARQSLNRQIYVFSHNIRGPLCTIEGLMNLLDHDLNEDEREKILCNLQVTYNRLKDEVDDTIDNLESQVQQSINNLK